MEPWGWSVTVAGAAILAVNGIDVLLTITHPDLDGPVTRRIQRALVGGVVAVARRAPRGRRAVLAMGGPLLIAALVLTWATLLIVGFALVAWPHMGTGIVGRDQPADGFLDALYYSGATATTLGYGDLVPVTPMLRILAFVEAASGFALMTGVLTYIFIVFQGISERNVAALRVHGETMGTGDGVLLVLRSVRDEGIDGLRERYQRIARMLRSLQEKLHRFPMLAFYYRSEDPAHDPETMLRAIVEATMAGHLLAQAGDGRRLRPVVEEVDAAVSHFFRVVAGQYFRPSVASRVHASTPGDEDVHRLDNIRARLDLELGDRYAVGATDRSALELSARARAFLDELDRITAWRLSDPRG